MVLSSNKRCDRLLLAWLESRSCGFKLLVYVKKYVYIVVGFLSLIHYIEVKSKCEQCICKKKKRAPIVRVAHVPLTLIFA